MDGWEPRAALAAGAGQVGVTVTLVAVEASSATIWQVALVTFALVATLSAWPVSSRSTRLMAAGMLLGSLVSALRAGWEPVWEGLVSGAGVVAFVVAAQTLGDALVEGGYDRLLRRLWAGRRVRTAALALGGGYALSWVFMFTSMPVMYSALYRRDEGPKEQASDAGKSLGILLARAYGAAAIATPMGATVLVALEVTRVGLHEFLLAAIPLSLLMVPVALIGLQRRVEPLDAVRAPTAEAPHSRGRVAHVLLWSMQAALAAMIITVSVLDLPPLAGVATGIILIAVVWGWLGRRFLVETPVADAPVLRRLERFGRRLSDGTLLMLAGSIVGTSLARSPIVGDLAGDLASSRITAIGIVVTIVVVVVLRMVGMPPPAIVLVAGPILVRALALENVAMAVLLVAASIFGFVFSPASLTSAMVSSMTGWPPAEVSLARQAPFVLVGGAVVCAYVLLIS